MSSEKPLNPQDVQGYFDRGVAYFKKEEWGNAIDDFSKAIELNPRNAVAYFNRGIAYLETEEWDKAIADFSKVIELNPQHADAYFNRGAAYFKKEEWDNAIANFSKAIELNPKYSKAYFARGAAYIGKKEWDRVIADYDKVTGLNPENGDAYVSRGAAYLEKEEWDKAFVNFDKAIEISPQNADVYFARGVAYGRKKEWNKAIADYDTAIKLNPQHDADAYINRGVARLKKEEWGKAIADFSRAIELNPQYVNAYFYRSFAYENKEEWGKAIADCNKAIELNPQGAEAYTNRGFAYFRKKEWDNAIADFSKAIELNPQYANAYFYRGFAYKNKEEWDNAIADCDKAIELNPQYANAYINRGVAYESKGELDTAIADYSEAIKLNPQNADAYFGRERAYLKKRESGQSRESSGHDQFLSNLLKIVQKIQQKLFYGLRKPAFAHYTSLDTLKNLVNNGRFRLYNSIYMNDPKEGSVFFEIMNERMEKEAGKEYDLEEIFYKTGGTIPYRSPAYIGSFTPVDSEKTKEKLLLWLAYGKQGKEEAAGSCLIFSREQFTQNQHPQVGSMSTVMTNKNVEGEEDNKLSIYKIVYIDEIPKDLQGDLVNLAQCLKKVGGIIEKQDDGNTKDKLKQLVRELLDSIRFLFKASHYEGEREVRVLQFHYLKEKSDQIKMDEEQVPPRFYWEAPESFRFSEVILGPRVRNFGNWKWWERWITEQRPQTKVKESDIPYGG